MLRRWRFPTVLALFVSAAIPAAQSAQDALTFRSGVEYVEVDVLVTDRTGGVVRNLTKDDFVLLEDGVPQQIASVAFVEIPVEISRPRTSRTPETDIATNEGPGHMYVMLLNSGGHRARRIAQQFVEEAVGVHDQVAVVHVLGNMSAAQGFTKSRSLMLAAIDRAITGPGTSGSTGADDGMPPLGDPIRASFEVLEELAERLGLVHGRRKVVLWFDPPSVFIPTFGSSGGAARVFAQRDALRAAARNNVVIYAISTRGLTTDLGLESLEFKAGLRVLADETGGDVIVDSNNFGGAFQRFVRDNSSHYVLGYVPAMEHRDGEFHRLTVRVNRPDVTVRARRGYYAPEPSAGPRPVPEAIDGLSAEAAKALRLPMSAGDLRIEAFAVPFRAIDGNGAVLVGAHLNGPDLALGADERIELALQAATPAGKLTPGAFKVYTLNFAPQSQVDIQQHGIRVFERLHLPPGRYQVTFVAHQPNGKTGSVVADVTIPDFDAPLAMSGLVLASRATAEHRTLWRDPQLPPMLPSDPTTLRTFSRDDVITAFTEVYSDRRRFPRGADVTVRLKSVSGERTRDLAPAISGNSGQYGYLTSISTRELVAGQYILTVEARAGDRVEKRQVLFAVAG